MMMMNEQTECDCDDVTTKSTSLLLVLYLDENLRFVWKSFEDDLDLDLVQADVKKRRNDKTNN